MKRALIVSSLAACTGSAPAVKAHDAPPTIDAPDAGCGYTIAGVLLDWDSGATAVPLAGAQLTDRDDTTRKTTTGADGTFALCIPSGNFSLVDIAPGGDYLPGLLFAKHDVQERGATFSVRSMTATRRDALFGGVGQTYDPTNAGQLLVHFSGTTPGPHRATVANTPALQQGFDATAGTWTTATDTGTYVFSGNVALGATANTLVGSDATGVIGGAVVPLEPGAITMVELFVP